MQKSKKMKLDARFLYLLIPMLVLELLFHLIQFKSLEIFSVLRVLFFVTFLAIFICFICTRFENKKVYFIFGLVFLILFCAYSFVELIFKNRMGDFYSFGTVGDGALRIAQYALIFIQSAKWSYYLCFVPIIIYLLLYRFVKFNTHGPIQLPLIICISSLLIMMAIMNLGSGVNQILEVYATFSNKTLIIDKCGIEHFLFRDLSALYFKAPEKVVIEEVEPEEPENVISLRSINDSSWQKIMESEENENMKTIDSYLMRKTITPANEKTGEFKDYNFIYFMVEAMDYLAIDKELTPTLYKMYNEGYSFYNHYTPVYSCATGESELVSYLSIFPYVNVCTPNYIAGDKFYEALPYMFKNKGYHTFAYHNWRDEFYERNTILPAIGFDEYYDIDDIWQDPEIPHHLGWQSDTMLIEQAIKHIEENKGKFFCNIITSVMHFPYEESSYWGDYYLDRVNEVHPEYSMEFKRYMSKCMDFDNGLKILLEYLEEAGLADTTAICIYPDHRPYWMDYDEVMAATRWINKERVGEYGIYRSPLIIYNRNLNGEVCYNYCSTLDHAPTIANLFDLNYDPRLFMGTDAFNGNNTVIFANGNWLNQYGIYDATTETFTPNSADTAKDDLYVSRTNTSVQNVIRISYMVMDEKYFENRRSICNPH